jgi:hypothetical protein
MIEIMWRGFSITRMVKLSSAQDRGRRAFMKWSPETCGSCPWTAQGARPCFMSGWAKPFV